MRIMRKCLKTAKVNCIESVRRFAYLRIFCEYIRMFMSSRGSDIINASYNEVRSPSSETAASYNVLFRGCPELRQTRRSLSSLRASAKGETKDVVYRDGPRGQSCYSIKSVNAVLILLFGNIVLSQLGVDNVAPPAAGLRVRMSRALW